jgi:hypothetical protein
VLRGAAEADLPGVGDEPEDGQEQRGLSRAVRPDEGGDLPAPDVGVDPRENLRPARPDEEIPDFEGVMVSRGRHRVPSASARVCRFFRMASS